MGDEDIRAREKARRRQVHFDEEVPLDRDEESVLKLDELGHAAEGELRDDPALDLLFRTRIRALKPRPPVTVDPGTTVAEACQRMAGNRIGCVLVVEGERLAGIFTERDVLYKVTCSDRRPAEIRIAEVMTPNPTTLRPGHRLAHALNKMTVDGCRHVPIVDEQGRPVGVVSVRRIVDFLVEQFPQALLNLPPDPDQHMERPEGG